MRSRNLIAAALVASGLVGAIASPAFAQFYVQRNLVSDGAIPAQLVDAELVNSWGLVSSATSPWWVADNGTGLATLYNGNTGAKVSLVVTVPGSPTGVVFNIAGTGFDVSNGSTSDPARFIFSSEEGRIWGWNPSVDPTNALLAVDNSANGAVYKGLAIATRAEGTFLYATNFHAGTVEVYDQNFNLVPGGFADPTLPPGFAPFGIQNINGTIYVTYALQDAAKHDDVAGIGNGFVNAFDTAGNLIRRVASGGTLNSPWGIALAPDDFGFFSNDLLVGNFGDGLIHAFDPTTGASLGQVQDVHGNAVHIDGLWGLNFGNGGSAGSTNTLFFTAGINGERNGLFGSFQPSVTGSANERFIDLVYQQLLNRQADAVGLTFWNNMLDQGVTRTQVVQQIEASDEFLGIEVQKVYQQFLHRTAEPAGVTFWTDFLKQGNTVEQMEAAIVSSPEYLQNRGGGTNDGFLSALFQDALNRTVTTADSDFFTPQFASGFTPAQVAAEVFASQEFRQDLVKADFQQFLHRGADTIGLNFYVNALNAGQTDQQVAASIAGSDEFFRPL